jgi:hypothetical protein
MQCVAFINKLGARGIYGIMWKKLETLIVLFVSTERGRIGDVLNTLIIATFL